MNGLRRGKKHVLLNIKIIPFVQITEVHWHLMNICGSHSFFFRGQLQPNVYDRICPASCFDSLSSLQIRSVIHKSTNDYGRYAWSRKPSWYKWRTYYMGTLMLACIDQILGVGAHVQMVVNMDNNTYFSCAVVLSRVLTVFKPSKVETSSLDRF